MTQPTDIRHVVMWSGGITSWAVARHVIATHGTASTVLLFADTKVEDPDLYRWNRDAVAQLGTQLVTVADGRDTWQVFEDERWLGNSRLAQCSHILKQKPCRRWLAAHTDPAHTTVYVGIDWAEADRLPAIVRGWKPWSVQAPLTQPPHRDKEQHFASARAAGLEPPALYGHGFAHNNCGGACVKGGQAQWARLLKVFPDRYARAEQAEQRIRQGLEKEVAILRERSDGQTTPLTLTALRERIQQQPEQLDLFDEGGCGCFTTEVPA